MTDGTLALDLGDEPAPPLLAGATADLSIDGRHRYTLGRRWDDGDPVVFVMLNPSTADAAQDDPTIRRCIGYARRLGAPALEVVNLYSLRATKPAELWATPAADRNDPHSDEYLAEAFTAPRIVIAAWGASQPTGRRRIDEHRARIGEVLDLIAAGDRQPFALGDLTTDGSPRHPLYLKADAELHPFTRSPLIPPAR